MKTSKEAIEYLKNNLDRKYYASMFIAGSLPEKLVPGSDLDIFIVIKKEHVQEFFNQTDTLMKKFIGEDKSATYSFFRGPIKYKNKGLIHLLTYTDVPISNIKYGEPFTSEKIHVLRSLATTAKVLSGEPLEELLKDMNLEDKQIITNHKDHTASKYDILKNKGYIKYREWKKTKNGWRFLYSRKHAGKWLREKLVQRYEKTLNNN